MAMEYVAFLKGKVDMMSMLGRLNAALTEEWQAYGRLFRAYERALERRRRGAPDADDAEFVRRSALC